MLEAVFISDLHLSPDDAFITHRFYTFIQWAAINTKTLYILGDFFHAWAGDDGLEPWSEAISVQLQWLSQQGVIIYFMAGNRDFLVGKRFVTQSGMTLLREPAFISFDNQSIVLVHGDGYCTNDKAHQRFRRVTRNRLFERLFLLIPLYLRKKLVSSVRQMSQNNSYDPNKMAIVPKVMIKHMQDYNCTVVIHGHIHQPGLTDYSVESSHFQQYVLSDWDDIPKILCYDKSIGFYFNQDMFLEDIRHA